MEKRTSRTFSQKNEYDSQTKINCKENEAERGSLKSKKNSYAEEENYAIFKKAKLKKEI